MGIKAPLICRKSAAYQLSVNACTHILSIYIPTTKGSDETDYYSMQKFLMGWEGGEQQSTINSMGSGKMEQWPWSRWVWSKGNVPKHSFICWLAGHGRLLTRVRLQKMGVTQDTMCTISDNAPETIEHLFFDCQFSRACMQAMAKWLNIGVQNTILQGIWRRLTRGVKGENYRILVNSVLAALIYAIWKARNEALWHQRVPNPGTICSQIQ
ncbi:PREDICTED: uncharacterized protein LOC109244525 [Nicotiana attenuata]|uniref:uncharacterized protein LOC109244525 n=1 Tax=Nicotiana attenuata TaxID=49451 RepID=UPI00090508D1|nr:PREDICTED: uncharacterized protein LOC109244525 [Nicotiana attenuata]